MIDVSVHTIENFFESADTDIWGPRNPDNLPIELYRADRVVIGGRIPPDICSADRKQISGPDYLPDRQSVCTLSAILSSFSHELS